MKVDYLEVNRKLWNDKVGPHFQSEFYDVPGFLNGRSSLNQIELDLLPPINGLKVLHLQCHFGLDTLSLARMGAVATGVDLADKAIEKACILARQLRIGAEFVHSDVYKLPNVLDGQFDLVFTSYGTIGWLPDLDEWASVVKHFLKPGGCFVMAEFHPVLWMFDPVFGKIDYSYFNKGMIKELEEGSYADRSAKIANESISWNHGLSEVISSLLGQGLFMDTFQEYDYSPYACFQNIIEISPQKYQIKGLEGKLPMIYALKMFNKG